MLRRRPYCRCSTIAVLHPRASMQHTCGVACLMSYHLIVAVVRCSTPAGLMEYCTALGPSILMLQGVST